MKRILCVVLVTFIAVTGVLGVVKYQVGNIDIQPELIVEEGVIEEQVVHNQVVGGPDCPGCKAIRESFEVVSNNQRAN